MEPIEEGSDEEYQSPVRNQTQSGFVSCLVEKFVGFEKKMFEFEFYAGF